MALDGALLASADAVLASTNAALVASTDAVRADDAAGSVVPIFALHSLVLTALSAKTLQALASNSTVNRGVLTRHRPCLSQVPASSDAAFLAVDAVLGASTDAVLPASTDAVLGAITDAGKH
ncbi:hypothetical protein DCS_03385 [Drechmeria coniospora]|uniref:Uncharacterized protein n=1 Tax=Drechmeria coniospora TaxID=98403 RepID=A0A151GH16_DRECN|nr:hypothetical protein DCS_03385 [Drechmeria coniospora]KYK56385.1 hypothetical protein DCS_03385 [Drechmeria coniospora]